MYEYFLQMDNVSQTGDSFCVKDYRDGDGTLATRPVAVATYRQITVSMT